MSYLEYKVARVPSGLSKVLALNWGLVLLVTAVASIGFIVLYSVGGGSWYWAEPQMQRFALGLVVMFAAAMIPIWFWRNVSAAMYGGALVLLLAVDFVGASGGGAQRWIDIGFMRLQPSELMKITLVLMLAAYYDWLPVTKVNRPQWVILPVLIILLPTMLVLKQPDLGTAILLLMGGAMMMFLAGVHWAYFATVFAAAAGYNITQSKIALGSGGWTGKGFMQGTQARLDFLPEKQTDFIFTILAEEFGLVGGASLLALYMLIIIFCIVSALRMKDRFSALATLGVAATFFLFFAVNMSMVMGMAPVVGVPLPLVSYGGSAMLVLMLAFGIVQSAHVHRPRAQGEGQLFKR